VDPRGPVVVVGAGTAGSVVARTLASSCDSEIIVVEPGGQTDDDNPRFLDHLVDATLWPGLPVPQARALGGGSAVNGMILSGAEPGWLAGLTRHARPGEEGGVGRQLLGLGGRHSRMWWNNGRWNPARAMLHVEEEGRLRIVRSTVERLVMRDGRATGVMTADGGIECGHVVMCAGAVLSPRVLIASGLHGGVGQGLQNHPTVTFSVPRPDADLGRFDACVVMDMSEGPAEGLVVAYERMSGTDVSSGMVTLSLLNPVSRGAVTADEVDFALLHADSDAAALLALVRAFLRAAGRSGMEGLRDSRGADATDILSMKDGTALEWLRGHVHAVSHATSSCASAVLPGGLLAGTGNVTVADASVLPGVPHETPAASVTIMARRIAAALGEDLP
jgi:choline dehydrogenase-like flavoprotein